jgi:hypothetical protein
MNALLTSCGSIVSFFEPKGPLQKATNRKEYNRVVENLMFTQGITREKAEKDYDEYLNNPNEFALNKVSSSMFSSIGINRRQ